MYDLCHRGRNYHGLCRAVWGYVNTSQEADIRNLELGGEYNILYDRKDPDFEEISWFVQYMGEGSSVSTNDTDAYFLQL